MKFSSVVGEARRNVSSTTSRAGLWCTIFASIVLTLALLDLSTQVMLAKQVIESRSNGSSVTVVSSPGMVDGEACEGLKNIDGVDAAGAIRDAGIVKLPQLPSSSIAVWDITDGFAGVLDSSGELSTPSIAGTLVSSGLIDELGLDVGNEMVINGVPTPIFGRFPYPDDGRRSSLARAILAPTITTGAFDECWFESWPPRADLTRVAARMVLKDDAAASDVKMTRLNPSKGTPLSFEEQYNGRGTRFTALWILLAVGACGFASVLTRRLELASALHARVPKPALVIQTWIEVLIWSTPASVACGAVLQLTAVLILGKEATFVIRDVWLIVLLAWTAVQLGGLVGIARVKEHRLLQLFKDR